MLVLLLVIPFATGCGDDNKSSTRNNSASHSDTTEPDPDEPYTEICNFCDGEGTWDCACGGVPSEFYICTCGGDGKKDCTSCNGTGFKTVYPDSPGPVVPTPTTTPTPTPSPTKCYKCNNTGQMTCTTCHGKGQTEKTQFVTTYGQGGSDMIVTYVTCRMCNGRCTIDCPYCSN